MRVLAILILLTLAIGQALAHGGGLNAEGCHNNRTTGDYHCHRPQVAAPMSRPAPMPARSSPHAVTAPSAVGTAGPASTTPTGAWVGDNVALIYFNAACEAAKAVPESRRVRVTRERSFQLMGYTRSDEPGC